MYFPYLRAKQYELKALREFAKDGGLNNKIVPILEPVKKDTSKLKLAIQEMMEAKMPFALILNPNDGDFKRVGTNFNPFIEIPELQNNHSVWIPAFLCYPSQIDAISDFITTHRLKEVMLILSSGLDETDSRLTNLLDMPEIRYIVPSPKTNIGRRIKKQLREKGLQFIRLVDAFKAKKLNKDYLNDIDELFTEEPFYFHEEGYDGYGDYVTLAADYSEGGTLPSALVIHLTYLKNEDQIFVHHFISDSINSKEDIRGKFREAASKVRPYYIQNNIPVTPSVMELISKAEAPNGYPGLGYLKKLSLKNHFQLILSLND